MTVISPLLRPPRLAEPKPGTVLTPSVPATHAALPDTLYHGAHKQAVQMGGVRPVGTADTLASGRVMYSSVWLVGSCVVCTSAKHAH